MSGAFRLSVTVAIKVFGATRSVREVSRDISGIGYKMISKITNIRDFVFVVNVRVSRVTRAISKGY